MKVTIGAFVLFDSHAGDGSALSGLDGQSRRLIDVSQPIEGEEPEFYDRLMDSEDLSFSVTRVWANEEQALDFTLYHPREIPRSGTITITSQNWATGSERSLYYRGKVESLSYSLMGVRTTHNYRLKNGIPRREPPTENA